MALAGPVWAVDTEGDGVADDADNCAGIANADQADQDGDGTGDRCDPDIDNDGFPNHHDSCPFDADPTRSDGDDDRVGDVCDHCRATPEGEDVDRRGCAEGETADEGAGAPAP
jgi:thrombospondin 2/3/4/5